mmetsp:Transcript_1930/g.3611  ORF Transcript_1930/g.3611 Transcript_1930/m.3611 type:complete len:271 (-) Transcript_1930:769-1581(-)
MLKLLDHLHCIITQIKSNEESAVTVSRRWRSVQFRTETQCLSVHLVPLGDVFLGGTQNQTVTVAHRVLLLPEAVVRRRRHRLVHCKGRTNFVLHLNIHRGTKVKAHVVQIPAPCERICIHHAHLAAMDGDCLPQSQICCPIECGTGNVICSMLEREVWAHSSSVLWQPPSCHSNTGRVTAGVVRHSLHDHERIVTWKELDVEKPQIAMWIPSVIPDSVELEYFTIICKNSFGLCYLFRMVHQRPAHHSLLEGHLQFTVILRHMASWFHAR